MKRAPLTFLASLCLLGGCAGVEPAATAGAAALGEKLTTMDDVVDWMRDTAGDCADVTSRELDELTGFVGADMAARYTPFVAEWATCEVSAEMPRVGLVLFTGDGQREFQESWRDALASGAVAEGPSFAFGNGFAISAGALGVDRLGLFWFRCELADVQVHRVRSDVDGCVFANSAHTHG